MKKLLKKLTAPTPKGYAKARNVALLIGGVAGLALTLPVTGTALVVAGAIAGVSSLVAGFCQSQEKIEDDSCTPPTPGS